MRILIVAIAWFAATAALGQPSNVWTYDYGDMERVRRVNAFTVWDPDGAGPATSILVMAGTYVQGANNIGGVIGWNGAQYVEFGTDATLLTEALAVFNGELYAAGQFDAARRGIARWNGSAWVPAGAGLPDSTCQVNALAVYNGELYAGGDFTAIGGNEASRIAAWNGTTWRAIGDGVSRPGALCQVSSLAVHDGYLWVGGRFRYAGVIESYNLARTNGQAWFVGPFGAVDPGTAPLAMHSFDSSLFVGGWALPGEPGQIGPLLVGTGSGPQFTFVEGFYPFAAIHAFAQFSGKLVVGGFFSYVPGPVGAANIALFDGAEWSALGAGISDSAEAVCAYKGYLFAGGIFDGGGSGTISGWARWGPVPCLGDMNCDGAVSFLDLDPLVEAFGYPDAEGWPYECPWLNGDCDQDGDVDFYDIDAFIARLGATCP